MSGLTNFRDPAKWLVDWVRGFWGEDSWGDFFWSAPVNGLAECAIAGFGKNVSITIVSQATYEAPHILQGLTLHYSMRGLAR